MDITGGTLSVSNSTFESMTVSILAESVDNIQVTECSFLFVGELHGPHSSLCLEGKYGVLDISESQNASLVDSIFSSYTPGGFVVWTEVENVIMRGNEIEIDTDGHLTNLYDVKYYDYNFIWNWAAVAFKSCGNVQITENVFANNFVQTSTPWIYIHAGLATTCFSANTLSSCCMLNKITQLVLYGKESKGTF